MKTFLSLATSGLFGLLTYWGYLSLVSGLSPLLMGIIAMLLLLLLYFVIRQIRRSEHKTIALIGFIVLGLALPGILIVMKTWTVDENHVRQYFDK